MSNIKEISTIKTAGNELVIETLESLLKQAKEGDIQGIHAIVTDSQNDVKWLWSGTFQRYTTLGAIEDLKHNLILTFDD